MKKKFIVYSLSLIVIVFTIYDIRYTIYASDSTPSAQAVDIGISRIHPASPFYFLKTIREAIEVKLAPTQRIKYLRQLEFANRRLRETNTLTSINEDLIPPTLEKYASHIKFIPDRGLIEKDVGERMTSTLTTHLLVLAKMHDQAASPRAKMFIRSTMYKIIMRADTDYQSRVPVCEFFQKEATSSALNDTEQLVLKNRAANCQEGLQLKAV